MKSNKYLKKTVKHSDIEKTDINSQARGVKKDKSTKRRLSIYDEFEEDEPFEELSDNDDDLYDE